ncbi:ferredoxin [Streptomyces sp. SID10815]|uniref:Ferredoxin n=2 Tax=Streptomyces TaxID=1883 RepID=A0A2S1P8R0_STRSO|nr:StmF [Streptomyces seoulensis]NEA46358.1 ferredoxin [Streptomyces sp. SID10815]QKW24907.1 ferredoxin [Streptomyces seoulensis]
MRIHLDRDKCIGSGQCVLAAPEWFDQDEDGIAVVLVESVPEKEWDEVNRAAYTCPALAISLGSE